MAKPQTIWSQVAIGAAASVLASVLIGGVAFANAMDNRTQALESASTAQGAKIRDQRLMIRDMAESIRVMTRKIDYLAAKAGYVPPEMGTPGP